MLEATNRKHHRSQFSAALIAFKPRQVLLADHSIFMEKKSLTSDQTTLLLHSVLGYLQNGGFSKTLKRFLSEAQIQNDNWKTSSLKLEDLFLEYSDKCKAAVILEEYKKEENDNDDNRKIDGNVKTVAEETIKKKKKRKTDVKAKESVEVDPEPKEDEEVEEKKKKKIKKDKPTVDGSSAVVDNTLADKKGASKDKKGKMELHQDPDKNNSVKESLDESVKNDKKSSKRKRLLSDDSKNESLKEEVIEEEPKRRKAQAIEEGKVAKVEEEQLNNHENGKLENNEEGKSAKKKSAKKENYGSAEPKTLNAFQRVKVDEVEFADEKLQDNSYWAKSGAEVGYGAKAQEILGQVRGRDFRHEKTKKKRGSYRGGQIDLDSHSIKFNYSDED